MNAPSRIFFESFESPGGPLGARSVDPVSAAFERGRQEGLTEGVLAGRAQGLEEGRAEGFAAGREAGQEAGRVEGRAAATEARDASLAAIADCFSNAAELRAEAEHRFAAAAAAAIRSALIAALPRLSRRGLADEAAALAREFCAKAALGEATLRVAPEHEEAVRVSLGECMATASERPIELRADPALGPMAAKLEWRDGLLEFDGEDAAERLIARLDAALAHASDPATGVSVGAGATPEELV